MLEHEARRLVSHGFPPRRIAALEDDLRRFVCSRITLMEVKAADGVPVDLHRDYSMPLSTYALAKLAFEELLTRQPHIGVDVAAGERIRAPFTRGWVSLPATGVHPREATPLVPARCPVLTELLVMRLALAPDGG